MSWAVFTFFVILGLILIVRHLDKISRGLDRQVNLREDAQAQVNVRPGTLAAMKLRGQRQTQERSARQVYSEYHLHRRFFQEARDGLVAFAERLEDNTEIPLTRDDLYDPLLHAQKGLNKVQDYAQALTSLLADESSRQKAQSMLSELRQTQGEVLTRVEQFYAKLEALEGFADFKDEFARWYVNRIEPHTVTPST